MNDEEITSSFKRVVKNSETRRVLIGKYYIRQIMLDRFLGRAVVGILRVSANLQCSYTGEQISHTNQR